MELIFVLGLRKHFQYVRNRGDYTHKIKKYFRNEQLLDYCFADIQKKHPLQMQEVLVYWDVKCYFVGVKTSMAIGPKLPSVS